MRILTATDAWQPQINGVQRTYQRLEAELRQLGHQPIMLTPAAFRTLPCPTYPEIRLALPGFGRVREAIRRARPDHVHIATEGPIGLMTRAACTGRAVPFPSPPPITPNSPNMSRPACLRRALDYSWQNSTEHFLENIAIANPRAFGAGQRRITA
ncbi:MAG: hypothetical protein C0605_00200 [Hyphomicrobiales bacterium]|nr:MAG: hypothetical protein C0605_00200 [Hyphomicrobiales bacterium]